MAFESILFEPGAGFDASVAEPPFFADLRLDQIVSSVIAGREEYELAPFFYWPLHDVEAVRYRQHVLSDLGHEAVLDAVRAFARSMQRRRGCLTLADKLYYERQRQRWFLESVAIYGKAVRSLDERLAELELGSPGFAGLREYLKTYAESERFKSLEAETRALLDELAAIRYTVHIKANRVRVDRYQGEPDISEQVERTFAKFNHGEGDKVGPRFREDAAMNHVEAQILDLVAKLHPEVFLELDRYCARHRDYLDQTIGRFDRELQFYLAYLEYIEPLKARGLAFSAPRVSGRSKDVRVSDGFDLALAAKLVTHREAVVSNDFSLSGPERILVVSGPNNGGKTTFARMFGQLHYPRTQLRTIGDQRFPERLSMMRAEPRIFDPAWLYRPITNAFLRTAVLVRGIQAGPLGLYLLYLLLAFVALLLIAPRLV